MPLLTVFPSAMVEHPEDVGSMLLALSKIVAECTGKSEDWIMTRLGPRRPMTFAGTSDPACYVECKSIGLTPSQAKELSPRLCAAISETFRVPTARIYIEFSSAEGAMWGHDGETFESDT